MSGFALREIHLLFVWAGSITVARIFSDTFAGIAPTSAAPFVLTQLIGGAIAVVIVRLLYPLDTLIVPDPDRAATDEGNSP